LILFVFAWRHARRRRAPTWTWGPPVTDPVTIVVPAYNEEKTIGPAVRSLALSAHPGVEVLVIDDASTDRTAETVEGLRLGNVRVVRVPSGGKATALSTGVALARGGIVVMVDADTVVDTDSVHRLV
jgi:glycosyltransferase involved in cell wall biosynthesis